MKVKSTRSAFPSFKSYVEEYTAPVGETQEIQNLEQSKIPLHVAGMEVQELNLLAN